MDKALEIKGRTDGKKIVTGSVEPNLTFKNDDLKFTKTVFVLGDGGITTKDNVLDVLHASDFDTAIGTKKDVLDKCFAAIQDNTV